MARATNHLWRRIWLTLGVLVVYRLGTCIPIPGIDPSILVEVFRRRAGVVEIFDDSPTGLIAPWVWDGMTLFALGILPYISAAIIVQLLTAVSPRLAALKQEGEAGRRKIDRFSCYGAVLLSIFLSYGVAVDLESSGGGMLVVVVEPGPWFRVTTVLTMTGGVILLMWLAGQIDRRGIGPGAFLILASAIAADLPAVAADVLDVGRTGALGAGFVLILLPLVVVAVVAASVVLACAHRPIFVRYPEQETGIIDRGAKKAAFFIPLCVAGLGPVVLAAMLVMPPPGIAPSGLGLVPLISLGLPVYSVGAVALVFVLTLLLPPAAANSAGIAAVLQERGAVIPDVQPGEDTAAQLDVVVRHLAPLAGLLIALVFVLPDVFLLHYSAPWASSGVSLLILTFVMLAVVRQIHDHLDPGAPPARRSSAIALWPAVWVWPDLDEESRSCNTAAVDPLTLGLRTRFGRPTQGLPMFGVGYQHASTVARKHGRYPAASRPSSSNVSLPTDCVSLPSGCGPTI